MAMAVAQMVMALTDFVIGMYLQFNDMKLAAEKSITKCAPACASDEPNHSVFRNSVFNMVTNLQCFTYYLVVYTLPQPCWNSAFPMLAT